MTSQILLPNNKVLYTDLREQIGSANRPFRLSGVRMDLTKPEINRKYCWIYNFCYLDDCSKFFEVHVDYMGKYVKIC